MSFYSDEAPAPSANVADKPYISHTSRKDEDAPVQTDAGIPIDEGIATADLKLTHEDKEALDTSNIIGERTRHAKPANGTYAQLGDEEGLPPLEEAVIISDAAVAVSNIEEDGSSSETEDGEKRVADDVKVGNAIDGEEDMSQNAVDEEEEAAAVDGESVD
ncbi:uncharacterized protein F4822DRAFT_434149 [Hypoxylon trugodes]|uniref:uncharacterized protein n=1 Tax=Hypoxylon trugodes TaxID=326681 RepID=UPI002190855D|nr:uncharacterized protein F4822DRAFT_434149 [Hypoxylon trugodes]KAI1384210.1 hypothetical protein F4822DRAFT_434149 [Hypoxylon trugodes]